MFHQLFERPHALQRQLTSPLFEDRLRYLTHRAEQGALPRTLREIAIYLLIVLNRLSLTNPRSVTPLEIERAATRWSQRQTRRFHRTEQSLENSKNRFRRHATRWISFLHRLKIPAPPPLVPQVTAFIDFMRKEQGLSEQTIQYRQHVADQFLKHIRRHRHSLPSVTLPQIDSLLLRKYNQGLYAPCTIQTQASSLRAFLRFAENRRWCRPGLSAGIKTPRVYHHANLPSSPTWETIQRLLKTTKGHHPTDIRDRAILLLLTVYGLRAGEVRRLRLEDLDWKQETLHITHSKSGRHQKFPMTKVVGQAILHYLQKVRPRSHFREVFLSIRAPLRPLASGALFQLVSRRLKPLQIPIAHHGPHTLRHACATRLINQGVSLKAIADQLGHRSLETTRIYAKVDLPRLREVARLSLGGLL